MSRFQHHIFICTNRRASDDSRGSCAGRDSEKVLIAFKQGLVKHKLSGKVRSNSSGCLDNCSRGPSVVIYPDGVWYGAVKPEDVEEIIVEHLLNGRPVERLRIAAFSAQS